MAAVAHHAATVVLCRDGAHGVEVYLQRRPQRMGFAGGLWVFPGGRVDDADRDPAVDARWAGPPPAAWATHLGLPVADARGHVVAACRETFEEAGVLLGETAAAAPDAAHARRSLLSGARTFADVLVDLGARIDTSLLRYWAWWLTPEAEPRRYDTRFFVARLTTDAIVTPHAGEVIDQAWARAPDERAMLPPTRHTLSDVVAHPSAQAVIDAADRRRVDRVLPVIDGDEIVLPWDERHRLPGM